MMPEFIVVELDLDQFIVAQRITDIGYRKFLTAVGRPSAEAAQAALMQQKEPASAFELDQRFDPSSRRVRDEARVRIEKDDEGIIEGARGDDTDRS